MNSKEITNFLKKISLFEGFSEHQLELVASIAREVFFEEHKIIIHEGEQNDNLYIIKTGKVEVFRTEKVDHQSENYRLAIVEENELIGEISVLDNGARSAMVRAVTPVTLIEFSVNKLRVLSEQQSIYSTIVEELTQLITQLKSHGDEPPYFPRMIENIAKGLGGRIRRSNDVVIEALRREVEYQKVRIMMGFVVLAAVCTLSIYIISMMFLKQMIKYEDPTLSTLINIPLLSVFAIFLLIVIWKSGQPLSFFGLTLKNWQRSIIESLIFSIIVLPIVVIFKWVLIHTVSYYSSHSLFEYTSLSNFAWFLSIPYLCLIPLQEVMVRGAFQSSFQELFTDKHRILWAIILSNLIFSAVHFHMSITLGITVFIMGLFWGLLYARHKTLIGVCISHQIIGFWGLFIVGF